MEARKVANHQFIDRPLGIPGLFFFKGLLNFLTKEETLTQVPRLLTSEVNNYLFITDYFQYKIGIAFQLALHTTQNSQSKWTKISVPKIKIIFELRMMVKSGLEFLILKFYQPLQRYLLTCQTNSVSLGSSNFEGPSRISK